ncbi:hypothetical protein D1872_81330 [compost metagenome]
MLILAKIIGIMVTGIFSLVTAGNYIAEDRIHVELEDGTQGTIDSPRSPRWYDALLFVVFTFMFLFFTFALLLGWWNE